MTTGVLDKHLLTHHPKKYGDLLQRKSVKVNENNRKAEEDNELENANISHSNLRNNKERKKRPPFIYDIEFHNNAQIIHHNGPVIYKARRVVVKFDPKN